MAEFPEARCPRSGEALVEDPGGGLRAPKAGQHYGVAHGVLDLRLDPRVEPPPEPIEAATLGTTLVAMEGGQSFQAGLEALLLELSEDSADALMLLLKESRGGWAPLLEGDGGSALFVGNALSGSSTPLAMAGYGVTVVDRNLARLRFALQRGEDLVPGLLRPVASGDAPRLPFDDDSFDLVVMEDGLPSTRTGWGFEGGELARVAKRELVLTADNRWGYKRSVGLRGRFHIPGPAEYLRCGARPPRGERSLRGYRRELERAIGRTRAFALYPHSREFSHVVGIDDARPRLTIGPKERRNTAKLMAHRAGLFPLLTPSFALIASRGGSGFLTRIERLLGALAERLGEPTPGLDQLVATRSNTGVIHTDMPGAEFGQRVGRWTLHLPFSPGKRRLVQNHHRFLHLVRERFPELPVPEPLFEGEIEGLWFTCERRLRGWSAPQYSGELRQTRNMFHDAAVHMALPVVREAQPLSEEDYARLVGTRVELVQRKAAVRSTVRGLERLRDRGRELLVGKSFPLVLYHADLRSKHVQVDLAGHVLGYMDWGASEECFLPYADLLHLIAHQRKQEEGCLPARCWEIVREREELRPHEREAIADHAERLGLDDEVLQGIEILYPALVAGMAERNWDYSRPRWVHRQFKV